MINKQQESWETASSALSYSFRDDSFGNKDSSLEDSAENSDEPSVARKVLADHENRTVLNIRLFLYLSLVVFTCLTSFAVYFLTNKNEIESFENQFDEDAGKVLQSFAMSLDLTLGAMDVMALGIASYARATNQTWPYVTIPDFGARAEKTRALTSAVYINLYQNVLNEQREKWEEYSVEAGRQWTRESFEFQERQGLYVDKNSGFGIEGFDDIVFWDVIHDYDEWEKPLEEQGKVGLDPNLTRRFLPFW